MERTPNKSQHTNLEKKILPPLLPGLEPAATFRLITSPSLYQLSHPKGRERGRGKGDGGGGGGRGIKYRASVSPDYNRLIFQPLNPPLLTQTLMRREPLTAIVRNRRRSAPARPLEALRSSQYEPSYFARSPRTGGPIAGSESSADMEVITTVAGMLIHDGPVRSLTFRFINRPSLGGPPVSGPVLPDMQQGIQGSFSLRV